MCWYYYMVSESYFCNFTNSKESVPPEKKAKIDKKTRHKIYDDEKKSQNICTNMDRDLSMGKIC